MLFCAQDYSTSTSRRDESVVDELRSSAQHGGTVRDSEHPTTTDISSPQSRPNKLFRAANVLPSTFQLQRTLILDAAIAYFLGSLFVVLESSISPGSGRIGLTEHDGAELLSCGAYTLGTAGLGGGAG